MFNLKEGNEVMKKVIMFFSVVIMFLFTFSFAETSLNIARVDDFKIVFMEKNKIFGSFEINEINGEYYDELKYMLFLVPKGTYEKNYNTYLVANSSEPGSFSLEANEEKVIAFEYEIPENTIPEGYYTLALRIYNNSSELLKLYTVEDVYVVSEIDGFLLPTNEDKTHFYKVKGFESPMSGPYFDIGNSPTAYVDVTSTFDKEIKVRPRIRFYKRLPVFENEELYQQFGKEVTLKSNQSKELAVELPKIKVPESYYFTIQLVDENDKPVSYEYNFRYVVNGETAKISQISTLYDSYNKTMKISVYYIGSSDGKNIEDVTFITGAYETETGKHIERYTDNLTLTPTAMVCGYSVKIPENGTKVTIYSIIKHGDKVLANKTIDLPAEATSPSIKKFTDVKDTNYELAVKMLNSYGIISGYPDGTFKPSKTLTRAELTSIALNMKKVDLSNYEVKNNAFTDVADNHWAYKAINYAYENGIINGYGNGLFKPNKEVTFREAITILVNTSGYKILTELNGGSWPDNYIQVAKDLGIDRNSNISDYSSPANRGEISLLTLNSYFIRVE